MKNIRLVNINDGTEEYSGDVTRIVEAMASLGWNCSREQALAMWRRYSEDMCAGWMILPDTNEEIVSQCRYYFEEIELPT